MKKDEYMNNINNINKFDNKNVNAKDSKDSTEYSYYSRVLKEPFETLDALKAAEAAYFAKIQAKETKAAEKNTDATRVQDAFKALNAARRTYKEKLTQLTTEYGEELENLKKAYELGRTDIRNALVTAEQNYAKALKEFNAKYPEGYHLTLKDGDFETTISSQTSGKEQTKASVDFSKLAEIFDMFFGNI